MDGITERALEALGQCVAPAPACPGRYHNTRLERVSVLRDFKHFAFLFAHDIPNLSMSVDPSSPVLQAILAELQALRLKNDTLEAKVSTREARFQRAPVDMVRSSTMLK